MQVCLNILSRKTIVVDVEPTDRIQIIRALVKDKEGIPCDRQLLIYKGKILQQNNATFAQYNIPNLAVINVERHPLKIKYRALNHSNYVSQDASYDIPENAKYHLFKVFGLISMTFYCMAIGPYLDYKYKLMQGNYSYGFYIATIGLIYYIWTGLNKKKHILLIILIPIIYGIVQGITIKYTLNCMAGDNGNNKKENIFTENNDAERKESKNLYCWSILCIAIFFTWYMIVPFVTSKQYMMHLCVVILHVIMLRVLECFMPWWGILCWVLFTYGVVKPNIARMLSPAIIFNEEKYQHLDYVIDASNFVADIVAKVFFSATRR